MRGLLEQAHALHLEARSRMRSWGQRCALVQPLPTLQGRAARVLHTGFSGVSATPAGAAGQLERAVGPVRRRMGLRQLQLQRDGAAAGGRRLRGRQRRARHAPRAGDARRGAALPPPVEHCRRAAGLAYLS